MNWLKRRSADPRDLNLLERYLARQVRLYWVKWALALGATSGVLLWAAHEMAVQNNAIPVGVIALVLALVGGVAFMLAWAVIAYWLGHSWARWLRRRGQTRPSPWHVVGILFASGLAAAPLGAYALADDAMWRAGLVGGVAAWHTATSVILGYVAPFWFRSERG